MGELPGGPMGRLYSNFRAERGSTGGDPTQKECIGLNEFSQWRYWMAAALAWGLAADVARAAERISREIRTELPIRVVCPHARFTFASTDGVTFHLDAAALGAVSLADALVKLRVQPADVSLPLPPDGAESAPGAVSATWDPTAGVLIFSWGPLKLSETSVPPGTRPSRVLVRLRDRIALLSLPPAGGLARWVWSGSFDFVLQIPEADQYLLCRDLRGRVGSRDLSSSEILEGSRWDQLDALENIWIEGHSPTREEFVHLYPVRSETLDERVDRALRALMALLKASAGREGGLGP